MSTSGTLQDGTPRAGTLRGGWRTVLDQPDRILLPTVVLSTAGIGLHVVLQHLIGLSVVGGSTCVRQYLGHPLAADCGPTVAREELGVWVALAAIYAVGHLVVAGIDRAVLDVVDGAPARGPFAGYRPLPVLVVALVMGPVLAVATVFCFVPALVVAFFTRYALLFVIDQGLGPVAATLASIRLVATDVLAEAGFAALAFLVVVAGVLALGLGAYVAVPAVLVAQAGRYRARVPRG